ncbi:HTH domain-containing protein [Microbispora sp. CA-102843]|uniref:HTH domain-containing protein n=1 Tax=Microbispora sp. CA-102843 TaxID=3239952 RepID=UPI003D8EC2EE
MSRPLSILLLLQSRGRLTARQLAEELEVSVRTIYRDVESLHDRGRAARRPAGRCQADAGPLPPRRARLGTTTATTWRTCPMSPRPCGTAASSRCSLFGSVAYAGDPG